MPKVSVTRCSSYEQEELKKAIEKSLSLIGGINKFIKKGDKVLIKPNMLSAKTPEQAVTTNPEFVRAVIDLVKKAGGIPYLGDSPGFETLTSVLEKSGIGKVCKETHTKIIHFNGKKFEFAKGKVSKSFLLHDCLFDFDLIINLPKLKTHVFTDYTGAVKNLFGLVVGLEKGKYHLRFEDKYVFSDMTLDLYLMTKPRLTIMDAIVGMEGDGPASGNPRKIDLVLASDDALSLDVVSTKIIGMENSSVIVAAEKRNLLNKIELSGEKIEKIQIKDFKKPSSYTIIPGFVRKILRRIMIPLPDIDKKICTGCENCFHACPSEPKTILMYDDNGKKYPKFNYNYCIRCYCCHEICPEKAIVLKRKII